LEVHKHLAGFLPQQCGQIESEIERKEMAERVALGVEAAFDVLRPVDNQVGVEMDACRVGPFTPALPIPAELFGHPWLVRLLNRWLLGFDLNGLSG